MSKTVVVAGILGAAVFLAGCLPKKEVVNQQASAPQVEQNESTAPSSFTARFKVVTNGTTRVFSQAMYLNQSSKVFLAQPDPTLIHVEQPEVTWADFFATLPFTLTENCLVTGTQQEFCSTKSKKLRFFLNEVETPAVLFQQIQPNDFLLIEYGD